MKITKQISEKVYEVELEDIDFSKESEFIIQHDFIGFKCHQGLSTKNSDVKLLGNPVCSNMITISNYCQIPIRMFSQFMMSKLKEHEYLQPEHLVTPDNQNKYNYYNQIVKYYDDTKKCHMVAICLKGESEFNYITLDFYEKFVKPNL